MTRPPATSAPDQLPESGYRRTLNGLLVPAMSGDLAVAADPALSTREAAIAAREAALARREAELDARSRSTKRTAWIAIATLFVTALGALGAWGGPVAQALIEHALDDGPDVARCVDR